MDHVMDHQTQNSCRLPKGKFLCISVLKSVIHMTCIGEYLSLSGIDLCKWILSVSKGVSVYYSSIGKERWFIDASPPFFSI